jgi:hypothetical protein
MNETLSVVWQLNEAARLCADPAHRDRAKIAAGRVKDALRQVEKLPSLENIREFTAAVGHGLRVFTLMPPMPEPPVPRGAGLREAA